MKDKVIPMFLRYSFFPSFFLLNVLVFPTFAGAQNCQGKVLYDVMVKPFGQEGEAYHYIKDETISEVRAHRASFFGKPSYYTSRGIGPLPAKAVKLLNCHPVYHKSEGFFDPGYDLISDDQQQKSQLEIEYRKPVPLEK